MGLWALVGAALLVSLAGVLSFGLFTYPLAVAGVVVVAVRPGWMRGLATMVSAAAVGLLLVAWLNREGPGRVCHSYPVDGVACSDPLNPWPFVAVAALALVVAVVLFVRAAKGGDAMAGATSSTAP